jgi:hypothetical protein
MNATLLAIFSLIVVITGIFLLRRWYKKRLARDRVFVQRLSVPEVKQIVFRSGDLILCQARCVTAQLSRFFARCPFSHVGIVIGDHIWHITSSSKHKYHPVLEKLLPFLQKYPGVCCWRPLIFEDDQASPTKRPSLDACKRPSLDACKRPSLDACKRLSLDACKRPSLDAWKHAVQDQAEQLPSYDFNTVVLTALNRFLASLSGHLFPMLPVLSTPEERAKKSSCAVLIADILRRVNLLELVEAEKGPDALHNVLPRDFLSVNDPENEIFRLKKGVRYSTTIFRLSKK